MSRGHDRERAVKRRLESEDWWVARAAGSLGDADLIALKDGKRPMLIEVKSSAAGPYTHFLPADREALLLAARVAGADAVLVWWPPRGQIRFISSDEWPRRLASSPDFTERVQRTLRENEQALSKSKTESAQREKSIKQSNIVVERAVNRLTRAGILK